MLLTAVDGAIEREHQAAIGAGRPWPPDGTLAPQVDEQSRAATPSEPERLQPQSEFLMPDQPGFPAAQPEPGEAAPADHGRAARLDELQARADQAAHRIDVQQAELAASGQYTARIERESQAEPEASWQAEMPGDVEMEL
jgi:hypothetical protein